MKVTLTKRCYYKPLGGSARIYGRPGQVVIVSNKDGDNMVNGKVAVSNEPKKVATIKPKKQAKK